MTDYALKKVSQHLGKPTKEGFSITTTLDGEVMAWYHTTF